MKVIMRSRRRRNMALLAILLNILREPMLLLLLGAGLIYTFLGEVNDALMLLLFVFVVVGITFYHERKSERALLSLVLVLYVPLLRGLFIFSPAF